MAEQNAPAAPEAEATVPEAITMERLKKGLNIALHPREVFWKLDSGKIHLNAFSGETSAKVEAKGMSDTDLMFILNGIRTGRIMVVDKVTKGTPVNTKWVLSEYAPGARKLLDYNDREFAEAVNGNYSRKLLQTALELEKEGHNRGDRIKVLNAKLIDIVRSA